MNKENSLLINNYLINLINKNNIALKINTDTSTLYSAYREIFEMENSLKSFKNNKAKKRFISEYKFSNEFYQLLEKNNLDQIVFTLQEGTIISQSTRNLNTVVETLTFPSRLGFPIPLNKDESYYKTWVIESKSKLIVFRNVTNDISDPLKQKAMPLQICYLFNGFYTRMSDTNSCFVLETK